MSRILLLSRDQSGLDPASATAARWRLLVRSGEELIFIVFSPQKTRWQEPGIVVQGTGGDCFLTRWWRAKSLVQASRVDLLSAQDPLELGILALYMGRKRALPVEIQDHGGFFDGQPIGEPYWCWRFWMPALVRRYATCIRTVSPWSFEMLQKWRPLSLDYHLPIAPHERFRRGTRHREAGLIVAVGRLVAVKQFSLLIDAFIQVRQQYPRARLILIGDGPERTHLERQIRSHRVSDVVNLMGATDPLPWLERAAVFAFPSLHEGWGVAAVEAALVGVPVVMSATGCAAWLAERGVAEVVPLPLMIPDLAAALRRGLEKEEIPPLVVPTAMELAEVQWSAWRRILASVSSSF